MDDKTISKCMLNRRVVYGDDLCEQDLESWAIKEIDWCNKKGIKIICKEDDLYPPLLKECNDAPILLYYKGIGNLLPKQSLSIVGTRLATGYGKQVCTQIINSFVENNYNPTIVSGLAYGIDINAHKSALDAGLETIAVLPSGLDIIYPSAHRGVACNIINQGAIITEFPRGTPPIKRNFIRRNRIIAGLTQATLIVESRIKGGSMLTVEIANSYGREIFAVPGRITDINSYGNNYLISHNVANIYCNDNTIPSILNWDSYSSAINVNSQKDLFSAAIDDKMLVYNIIKKNNSLDIYQLVNLSGIKFDNMSIILLDLELEGKITYNFNRYSLRV